MLQIKNLDSSSLDSSSLGFIPTTHPLPGSSIPFSAPPQKSSKINIETVESRVLKQSVKKHVGLTKKGQLLEKTAQEHAKLAKKIKNAVLGEDPLDLKAILDQLTTDVQRVLVNVADEDGQTPLMHCAKVGNIACMHLLITAGADPLSSTPGKNNFVHFAVDCRHSGMLEIFLERLSKEDKITNAEFLSLINAPNKDGLTPLLLSCNSQSIPCMNLLIDLGVDPAQKDSGKRKGNFLHWAAHHGHSQILAAFLLKISKDPRFPKDLGQVLANASDKQSKTPLLATTESGSVECMNRLLDAGAKPLYTTSRQANFVHFAAEEHRFEQLEHFFKRLKQDGQYGNNICSRLVNASDDQGNPPLFWCPTIKGGIETIRLLLEYGADAMHRNVKRETVLHLITQQGNTPLLESFLQWMSERRFGSYRCKTLIHARTQQGETPIILCGFSGSRACLDILLNRGANLFDVSTSGSTVYDEALAGDKREFARSLLQMEPRFEGLFALNLLQHVFGFRVGEVRLPGILGSRLSFNGGSHSHIMQQQILDDLLRPGVQDEIFGLLDESSYRELIAAFAKSCLDDLPREELAETIRSGKLVILRSGWEGHAITLVFRDGYLVICNRGEGNDKGEGFRRESRTFFARKITLSEVTVELLEKIKAIDASSSSEKGMRFFYRRLPRMLNAKSDVFCAKIKNKIAPKESKVGVCSYAAGKAALRAALALMRKKQLTKAKNASKHWALHHREWALEYFKTCPSPFTERFKQQIITTCSGKLTKLRRREL